MSEWIRVFAAVAQHADLARRLGGAGTVGGPMLAGASLAETSGAIVGAIVGVVTLAITVVGLNERRRRQYRLEIRKAVLRGFDMRDSEVDGLRSWATYVRDLGGKGQIQPDTVLPPLTPPLRRPTANDGSEDGDSD